MNITKELVSEKVVREIDDALDYIGLEAYCKEVVSVDLEKQEITIKFCYNIVESDKYVGLASY